MLRDLSCEGRVTHRRSRPVDHAFAYPVWMVWADPEALPERLRLTGGLLGTPSTVRQCVNDVLAREGLAPHDGPLRVLAQPGTFARRFNPVVFVFCLDGDAVRYVIAEITNTPWGERHAYVLDAGSRSGPLEFGFDKTFHVSPFAPMDVAYRWRFELSDTEIRIGMRLLRGDEPFFYAGLDLRCAALEPGVLRRCRRRYALQNARTLARIYWQALRLYLKRAPFHPHPAKAGAVPTDDSKVASQWN